MSSALESKFLTTVPSGKSLNPFLLSVALGLRCCAQAFSSCGKQGQLFVAVLRLFITTAMFLPFCVCVAVLPRYAGS